MTSQSKRFKNMSEEKVCSLCRTQECMEETSCGLPSKQTIGPNFESLPNEVIYMIAKKMSLKQLSNMSITNKWFRDFIVQHFFESESGLSSLLGSNYRSTSAKTSAEQQKRLDVFFEFGLLLKRVSCLYPTQQRIDLLVKVFHRLDGIPKISSNPLENQNMRFVFQCYGRLVRHLVSGWDDSELKHVFKKLQSVTQMEETIKIVAKNPIGVRNTNTSEYYIRSFYRMMCIDPNRPSLRSDKGLDDDRVFWLKSILGKHSLQLRARLMLIVFGPLISQSPIPSSTPYIGYWDLTDTFFIHSGLEELGEAIRVLYIQSNSDQKRRNVISLMEAIMKIPTNWLLENMASLLFHSGDEITFDYLWSHIKMGNYSEVAQKLVFLTLVSYKLTKETKYVYDLIQDLTTNEANRISLANEVQLAFSEAFTDIDNAVELEDERDVVEVHELVEAQADLLKNFIIRPFFGSSQQSKESPKDLKALAQNEE